MWLKYFTWLFVISVISSLFIYSLSRCSVFDCFCFHAFIWQLNSRVASFFWIDLLYHVHSDTWKMHKQITIQLKTTPCYNCIVIYFLQYQSMRRVWLTLESQSSHLSSCFCIWSENTKGIWISMLANSCVYLDHLKLLRLWLFAVVVQVRICNESLWWLKELSRPQPVVTLTCEGSEVRFRADDLHCPSTRFSSWQAGSV